MKKSITNKYGLRLSTAYSEDVKKLKSNARIIGLDFARAWAMFGMLVVNFVVITNAEYNGPHWLVTITSLFQGRASALFVLLAGIGISLMTRNAIASGDKNKILNHRKIIWKRSLFLFIIGLGLYILEWTGDILHYYGVYLFIAAACITLKDKWLIGLSTITLLVAQSLQLRFDTLKGWNSSMPFIEYIDFWTVEGFLRHLFFNGYHPIFPWMCFLFIGMVIGRIDLSSKTLRKKLFTWGLAVMISVEILSYALINLLIPIIGKEAAIFLFSTGPILPNFLYVSSASGSAIVAIVLSLFLTERANWFISAMIHTGQLTLTHYVSHVIVGMGILITLGRLENQSLVFALLFSTCFFVFSITVSVLWRRTFSRGPFEMIMRKMTG